RARRGSSASAHMMAQRSTAVLARAYSQIRFSKRSSMNVRLVPEATELLRRREMSRCATSGPEQMQQNPHSLDDFGAAANERRRHGQAHRSGSLEIDDQLEFGCQL